MYTCQDFIAISFPSTFNALEAQRITEERGIPARLIPKPEVLGNAECGLALRICPQDQDATLSALASEQIAISNYACIQEPSC